jgi:hypothetical protein
VSSGESAVSALGKIPMNDQSMTNDSPFIFMYSGSDSLVDFENIDRKQTALEAQAAKASNSQLLKS